VSILDSLSRFLGVGEEGSPTVAAQGSLLGKGLILKGELTGEGDLVISGRFEGEIVVTGVVHVEAGAHVDANITATAIVIGGVVRGNISAATRVEILPTGALTGSLKTGSLSAVGGASVKGEVWVEPPSRSGSSGISP
jgi:cytoskeletal protein CcmA (bactofilin family)